MQLKAAVAGIHNAIIFRVSAADAQYLSSTLSGYDSETLQNLTTGQAVVRLGAPADSFTIKAFNKPTRPPQDFTGRRATAYPCRNTSIWNLSW